MEVPLAAGDHSCDCAEIIWQWLAQEVRDGFGYNARFVVIVPATETGWIKSGGASGVSNHPEHRCRSLFVYVLSHRCGMHAPVYFRVTYWVADFQNFLRRLNGNHRQLNPSGAHLLSTQRGSGLCCAWSSVPDIDRVPASLTHNISYRDLSRSKCLIENSLCGVLALALPAVWDGIKMFLARWHGM